MSDEYNQEAAELYALRVKRGIGHQSTGHLDASKVDGGDVRKLVRQMQAAVGEINRLRDLLDENKIPY